MKKIIAVEVAPEHTESPLLLLWAISDIEEGLIFDGNRDYRSHMTDEYSTIKSDVENALYYIDNVEIYVDENATETELNAKKIEIIKDYLELDVTEEQLNYVIDAIESVACKKRNWENSMCFLLQIATGKEYDHTTIRGCMQSEWQTVYYPSNEWTDEMIRNLGIEYFNMGTEYLCYEIDTEVVNENDIRGDNVREVVFDYEGCTIYTHDYDVEDQSKEIAEGFEVSPEDIIMFSCRPYTAYAYTRI